MAFFDGGYMRKFYKISYEQFKKDIRDDKKLYEYHGMGHRHYLVCLGCRQMITIENCPLHEYEKQLEKDTEFAITGHKLYLYGYCKECASLN